MKKMNSRIRRRHYLRQLREMKSRWRKQHVREVSKYRNPNRVRPFEVTIWDGREARSAICVGRPVSPPPYLNFDDDILDTLRFLKSVRDGIGRKRRKAKKSTSFLLNPNSSKPTIRSFLDFSQICEISISAALVIASCYDRVRRILNQTPVAVNYDTWPHQVFKTLLDVGFFEFIGHIDDNGKPIDQHNDIDGGIKAISALTGKNANGLEECSEQIHNLLLFLELDNASAIETLIQINSAVSEAMINVARHAYPSDFVERSPYDTVGQWWMTAQADKRARTLKIVLYDQGATIPGTLPKLDWFRQTIENSMRLFVPGFVYSRDFRRLDHEYINYSMKEGKTQTSEKERGLGLPQMQSLIDVVTDGTLTILSRAGLYRYDKVGGVHKKFLPIELEGTLVEWHLTFPDGAKFND